LPCAGRPAGFLRLFNSQALHDGIFVLNWRKPSVGAPVTGSLKWRTTVKDTISITDFDKLDIRIGKIIKAEEFPKARKPACKLWIDLGELGIKKSSAQITHLYKTGELAGKYVVAVANFPPRQVADFTSEVLVLGAVKDDGACVLLSPDRPVKPGNPIS
jgi:tRNA-binding protein